MTNNVKSGEIELESNEESCQAYSEIKDLEFHSRSKIDKRTRWNKKVLVGKFLKN